MKTFIVKVDARSRKAMVNYLAGHFRYNTMNSWNAATSYAHNMKLYNLGLDGEMQDRLYALMECEDAYRGISDLITDFDAEHGYSWQAGFNGRSGGYLVLYRGGRSPGGGAYTNAGAGTDQGEDFADWDMAGLRERVKLVQEFDELAERILREAARLAKHYEAADEEVLVKRTRKVLREAV